MESKLIDCCLFVGSFKINHEGLLKFAGKMSFEWIKKSDPDFIRFKKEALKFLVQGSQEQIKMTLNNFRVVGRLCEKCVNYHNNFEKEAKNELESLILAQQIQEKLQGKDKGGKHE